MNPAVCAHAPARVTIRRARPLLGTLVEIAATADSDAVASAAVARAFDAVATIQSLMSYHDPASDVSRLNRAGAAVVDVDAQTWHVLDVAQAVSAASDGLFDVSVAPELVRHGYLPRHDDAPRPARDASWRDIELLADRRVRLARPLQIDLGGIAKGHAVDAALRVLRAAGVHAARVNAGGDLRVFGDTTQTIHVRHPRDATRLLPLCGLREGALATSALYFSKADEQRPASPLIDARTRRACDHAYSVSVLADDCIVADALTKVVFADPARAPAVLERFGAHAVIADAVPATSSGDALPAERLRRSDAGGWRAFTTYADEGLAA